MTLQLSDSLVLDPVRDLDGEEHELMAWVRYDDGFYSHPKVTAVIAEDPAALSLHVLANTWTNAQKRPGFVPAHQPGILIADRSLGAQWAKVLVTHGLWHDVNDMCEACASEFTDLGGSTGYVIHDAKHYRAPERDRTTPGTPAELSEKRRAAGRKGGKASAAKRSGKQAAQTSADGDDASKSSNLLFGGVSKTSNLLFGGVSPEPVPVTTDASNEASGAEDGATDEDAPEPVTAQTILGEYIDRCRKRPPNNVLGQMAKQIKALLAEDYEPDDIRRGIAQWMTKDVHPSVLPSIVNNLVNGNVTPLRSTGTDGRYAPGSGSDVPPRDSYDPEKFI